MAIRRKVLVCFDIRYYRCFPGPKCAAASTFICCRYSPEKFKERFFEPPLDRYDEIVTSLKLDVPQLGAVQRYRIFEKNFGRLFK